VLIATIELLPYNGKAEPRLVATFQQKTGFILYAVVITRLDIAFVALRLVRFNTNPGPQYYKVAD